MGFVIAKYHYGEQFLCCYGQPIGINPWLFRSKTCSLLAAVWLICLLVEYYNNINNTKMEIKAQFQIYTNSLSMIKKLHWIDKYPSAPFQMTLHTEWGKGFYQLFMKHSNGFLPNRIWSMSTTTRMIYQLPNHFWYRLTADEGILDPVPCHI